MALTSTPQNSLSADALDGLGIYARGKARSEYRTLRIKPEDGEIWIVPGDIHFGIEDSKSLDLMFRCAEDLEVDRFVFQGDTFDCYGISRHDKAADRIRRGNFALVDERECARPWLQRAVETTGKDSILLWGNHEQRIRKLEDDNPALDGCLSMRALFDIPEGIAVGRPGDRVRAGSLVVEHGHDVKGSLSQNASKAVLSRQPDQTTIYGHNHRINQWRQTTYDEKGRPRTRMALSVGHLSRPECHADYAGRRQDWQQGFAVVQFWTGKGRKLRFTVDAVEIHDHEFNYRGKTYR